MRPPSASTGTDALEGATTRRVRPDLPGSATPQFDLPPTQPLHQATGYVLGIPYDGTSDGRPLQRHAPQLIRSALTHTQHPDHARLFDAGDVLTEPLDYQPTHERTRKTIERFHAQNAAALPLILGGEHTISLGPIQALQPASLISLDAHPDLWDTQHGKRTAHGTWLRRAIETHDIPAVLPLARAARGREQDAIQELGIHTSLPETLPEPVYLSIDIDVFDPHDAPSVVFPEPEGPAPETVLTLIEDISRRFELAGVDVVEVNANRLGPTSKLAAECLTRVLAGRARAG